MSADDFVAIGWISLGAVASSALTLAALLPAASVPSVPTAEPASTWAPIYAPVAPRSVIDFAIIREEIETMVGPEGAETGWMPPGTPGVRKLR